MVLASAGSSAEPSTANTVNGVTVQRETRDAPRKHSKDVVICSVNDYQRLAKNILPKALYEYIASGTDDEQTLAANQHAFKQWYLRPRMMRSLGPCGPSTQLAAAARQQHRPILFPASMPLFVSPAGVQNLASYYGASKDDDYIGEAAVARACGRVGAMYGLSQHATCSIEDVAAAAPHTTKWYQCYILKDRNLTIRLVQRAIQAGYQGIFLTVDSVRFGYREADARNGFDSLPPPHRLVNYDEPNSTANSSTNKAANLEETYNAAKYKSWDQNSEQMFDQDATWEDVRWLRTQAGLDAHGIPLVVKGILTAEDASLAVEVGGADGVMVSTHGGRQLDGSLASLDALPEVVAAVGSRVPVFIDSGIRRGTDILKALALGATAVGIGKPVYFALAVGGESAVYDMLCLLHKELVAAMALCGCRSPQDVWAMGTQLVTRHPSGSSLVPYIRSSL